MESPIASTGPGDRAYRTGFVRWRAAENGFERWTLDGVRLRAGGELELATASPGVDPYPAGAYRGGKYYNGGAFFVGEAISPEMHAGFAYKNAIASWNADTPAGSWLEIQFRACYGGRWSKWYILGIWAADDSTIHRHSVQGQKDLDGSVADDTFISLNESETTSSFQLKIRLFSADGAAAPGVRNAAVAYATAALKPAPVSAGHPGLWDLCLDVPQYSQMIYPDGGDVWCSPTSTSMVLAYLDRYAGECEPRVHAAVKGVYDWIYGGHGNWPFNTAYAAARGYEGYVARLSSLAKVEEYVAAGIPVIMSLAWDKGQLTHADVDSTNGHLVVLVGFDSAGNPIVNDPAAPTNERVRRTYLRSEFEPLWLQSSGGTVYLIYPEGASVPALP